MKYHWPAVKLTKLQVPCMINIQTKWHGLRTHKSAECDKLSTNMHTYAHTRTNEYLSNMSYFATNNYCTGMHAECER